MSETKIRVWVVRSPQFGEQTVTAEHMKVEDGHLIFVTAGAVTHVFSGWSSAVELS